MSNAKRVLDKHLYAYYWRSHTGYVFQHWLIEENGQWWKVGNDATGWADRIKWDGDTDITKVRAGRESTWVVGPVTHLSSVELAFERVGLLEKT